LASKDLSSNTVEIKKLILNAKKFHTWVIALCHEIGDVGSNGSITPVSVFKDYIDWLHAEGMQVLNFSEVYAQYPLANDPSIDFSKKNYIDFYTVKPPSFNSIVNKADLSKETPIAFNIDKQPDAPRSILWNIIPLPNISNFVLEITGIDAKGITQNIKITDAQGWSGETQIALASISSIQMISRTGTGAGCTLSLGLGTKIGIRKIYSPLDITLILKDGQNLNVGGYVVDLSKDTIDLPLNNATDTTLQINYQSYLYFPRP